MFFRPNRMNYFQHLLTWWPKRNDPNVLLLSYEDMLEDLETAVKTVASFIVIDDQVSIANAGKMSSFDFMKQNQNKFQSTRLAHYRNKTVGLPDGARKQRIGTGSATKYREVMLSRYTMRHH